MSASVSYSCWIMKFLVQAELIPDEDNSIVQVECQSVAEALEACGAGADIIMLDNFTHETIGAAAAEVKAAYPHVLVEASGVSCGT